jgi:DNA-binding CsgD family transcriptional regulator
MSRQDPPRHEDLTAREREVLAMVADGKTNREIGAALFISESTAGVHVSNIMGKLGAGSRTEAVAIAFRGGLVEGSAFSVDRTAPPELTDGTAHEAPEPTGWRGRLRGQWRRHPRASAIAAGAVVVLSAITAALAFAVLVGDRPTGGVVETSGASPSPTVVASTSLNPTTVASASRSPTGEATDASTPGATGSPSTEPPAAPAPTPAPNARTWTATGEMLTPRQYQTATLLLDDTVLVVGGASIVSTGGLHPLRSTERYDPSNESWSATGNMATSRISHTATLLPDGRVLVTGGQDRAGNALASVELYDPGSGSWTTTESMAVGRALHTATLLSDGRVLVAGGRSGFHAAETLDSAELYDPDSDSWTSTAPMERARGGQTATLLPDGDVLVAGGVDVTGPLFSAELYDPSRGAWTATGTMDWARGGHTATLLPNGWVLVAGGEGPLAGAELYDPGAGSWAATGNMGDPRCGHTANLMPDGKVLVAGSTCSSDRLASAELYDPISGSWSIAGDMIVTRSFQTATLLTDGAVLVAGTPGSSSGPQISAELYVGPRGR